MIEAAEIADILAYSYGRKPTVDMYKTADVLYTFAFLNDRSRRTGHAERFVYKKMEAEAKARH